MILFKISKEFTKLVLPENEYILISVVHSMNSEVIKKKIRYEQSQPLKPLRDDSALNGYGM